MKTLTIAALSSVAILMGASAGFASPGQWAGASNNDQYRCADALRTDGSSINPNVKFCTPGAG